MKRFFIVLGLVCAIVFGAVVSAKAEVVAKDTVAYDGGWKMEKLQTTNDYGEVSVRYVCYLYDIVNSKGEPRKVYVDKATYESDNITHIVFNIQDTGAKRIAKAINIGVVRTKVRGKEQQNGDNNRSIAANW